MIDKIVNNNMDIKDSEDSEFLNEEKVYPDYEEADDEFLNATLTDEELQELTEELEVANFSATIKRTRKTNLNTLNTILSEYFDSYLIVGYTAENDEVVAHKLNSSKDLRAINSLLDDISLGGFSKSESEDD